MDKQELNKQELIAEFMSRHEKKGVEFQVCSGLHFNIVRLYAPNRRFAVYNCSLEGTASEVKERLKRLGKRESFKNGINMMKEDKYPTQAYLDRTPINLLAESQKRLFETEVGGDVTLFASLHPDTYLFHCEVPAHRIRCASVVPMNADNVELESGGLHAHVLKIGFSTDINGRHLLSLTARRAENIITPCTYHDHL